jgi:hypothetical protein
MVLNVIPTGNVMRWRTTSAKGWPLMRSTMRPMST